MFVPQKLPLWKNLDDVIAYDLWFRPPPIKNSGYAYELEIAGKTFLKTFFWGRTLVAVALASSIPVLGLERVCPRKGCPWPWPWPRIFFCVLGLGLVSSTSPLPWTRLSISPAFWVESCNAQTKIKLNWVLTILLSSRQIYLLEINQIYNFADEFQNCSTLLTNYLTICSVSFYQDCAIPQIGVNSRWCIQFRNA